MVEKICGKGKFWAWNEIVNVWWRVRVEWAGGRWIRECDDPIIWVNRFPRSGLYPDHSQEATHCLNRHLAWFKSRFIWIAYLKEILQPRVSRSLKSSKVTTDRSDTYDFLLVFNSKYDVSTVSQINCDSARKTQKYYSISGCLNTKTPRITALKMSVANSICRADYIKSDASGV